MENLLKAWDEFKKGKREKLDAQIFERHLEDNLFSLRQDLSHKRYRHGRYTGFYIHDPKVRRIHKAEVRDRIVHHAVFRALHPIFEKTFIADSYSARVGQGTHRGIRRLGIFLRKTQQTRGRCFVLKCDIKKFFATLDHAILLDIVNRRIQDPETMRLVKNIIRSFSSEFSVPGEAKGAPIGNLTSQLFANIYMNELDQFIKHGLHVDYYIRYTDDFLIVHHDENHLHELKGKIDDFLKTELKLSLHPHKVSIRKYRQGIDFLGYVTLPGHRVLRTRVKQRMFKKLEKLVRQYKAGEVSEEKLMQSFNSYLGVLGHANSHKLEEKLRQKIWEWLKTPS